MSGYIVHWRGKTSIDRVTWTHLDDEITLPDHLEERRLGLWRELKEREPAAYDGDCLYIHDMQLAPDRVHLTTRPIKFSKHVTLLEKRDRVKGYGSIGVNALIYNPEKTHLLVGVRSDSCLYYPGYHTVPTGLLSKEDTNGTIKQAFLREVEEETTLQLAPGMHLIAITTEHRDPFAVQLLIQCTTKKKPDTTKPVPGNHEWKNNQLHWTPLDQLIDIYEKSFIGVKYPARQPMNRLSRTVLTR